MLDEFRHGRRGACRTPRRGSRSSPTSPARSPPTPNSPTPTTGSGTSATAVALPDGRARCSPAGRRPRFVELGPRRGAQPRWPQDCLRRPTRPAVAPALRAGGRRPHRPCCRPRRGLHAAGVGRRLGGRCSPAPAPAASTCRPTPSSGSGTGWTPAPPPGDVDGAGLGAAGHPLLGAAVELPTAAGCVLHRPAVRRHATPGSPTTPSCGTVLLPGTAFVELALHAGRQVGCRPRRGADPRRRRWSCPSGGGVQLQVAVGAADDAGRRPVAVHSRPGRRRPTAPWTRHATGTLAAHRRPPPAAVDLGSLAARRGAEPVDAGRASTTDLAGPASATARPSRACAPAWRPATRSSPRSRLPEAHRGRRRRSACTRRCWTPPCTPLGLPATRTTATARVGCRSPGPACALHAAGARPRCGSGSRRAGAGRRVDAAPSPTPPAPRCVTVDALTVRPVPADRARHAAAPAAATRCSGSLDWRPPARRRAARRAAGPACATPCGPDAPVRRRAWSPPAPRRRRRRAGPATAGRRRRRPARPAARAAPSSGAAGGCCAALAADERSPTAAAGRASPGARSPSAPATTSPTWPRGRCGAWCAPPSRAPGPVRRWSTSTATAAPSAPLPARRCAAERTAARAARRRRLRVPAGPRPPAPRRPRPTRAGPVLDPDGTVLVTGGTGALGALVARHLVAGTACGTCCWSAAAAPTPPAPPSWPRELTALGAEVDRGRLRRRRPGRARRRCSPRSPPSTR